MPFRPAWPAAAAAVAAARGGAGPRRQGPGAVQLPIPSHDIGPRGPHVAPGSFKVTLEVDGAAAESRTFEVRADPGSKITLAEHKARDAFEVEVMDLLAKIEKLDAGLTERRKSAAPEESARLQALQQRLVGGGGGRGGRGRGEAEAAPGAASETGPAGRGAGGPVAGAGRGGRGGAAQPVRQRLAGLITAFVGSGARTGTLSPPTGPMRATLAEAKAELAAIEKEVGAGLAPARERELK